MKRRPSRSPSAPAPVERRTARRVGSSRSARLLDISPTGLHLETEAPLEQGRVYDLLIRVDDHRISVAARVVRLRRSGTLLRAGMAFERIFDTDRAYLEQVLVREVAERITVVLR